MVALQLKMGLRQSVPEEGLTSRPYPPSCLFFYLVQRPNSPALQSLSPVPHQAPLIPAPVGRGSFGLTPKSLPSPLRSPPRSQGKDSPMASVTLLSRSPLRPPRHSRPPTPSTALSPAAPLSAAAAPVRVAVLPLCHPRPPVPRPARVPPPQPRPSARSRAPRQPHSRRGSRTSEGRWLLRESFPIPR